MHRLVFALAAIVAIAICPTAMSIAFAACGDQVSTQVQAAPPVQFAPAPLTASQSATIGQTAPAFNSQLAAAAGSTCTQCSKAAALRAQAALPAPTTAVQNTNINAASTSSSGGLLASLKGSRKSKAPQISQVTNVKPVRTGPLGRLFGLDEPSVKQTTNIRN
jgi:hypothetical protein